MLCTREYNREHAVEYAKRWAYERNPLFENYTGFRRRLLKLCVTVHFRRLLCDEFHRNIRMVLHIANRPRARVDGGSVLI